MNEASPNIHLVDLVQKRLGPDFIIRHWSCNGDDWIRTDSVHLIRLLTFLRDDPDSDLKVLADLFSMDHTAEGEPNQDGQYEMVYLLHSARLSYRIAVSVLLPKDELILPSAANLFEAAEWLEREIWESFGIQAVGHPNLRRLLSYPGFEGYPMRKMYPRAKTQPLVPLRQSIRAAIIVGNDHPEGG
jgi:NADH-quinone oxidoreductase subunit C